MKPALRMTCQHCGEPCEPLYFADSMQDEGLYECRQCPWPYNRWSLSSFGASASACAVATSSTEDASIERDGKKLGGPIGPVPEPFQLGC